MRVAQINSVLIGSTGRIMNNIANQTISNNNSIVLCVPQGRHNKKVISPYRLLMIGNRFSEDSHIALARITGFNGCFSWYSTRKFLKELDRYKPDILHFHNLHNCYINLPMLFRYVKRNNIPVVWTLHDCWAFTGHCPYFTAAVCNKWRNGCYNCSQYRQYPSAYVDMSKTMWQLKKKWFSDVNNMIIVTPSWWLADLVGQSFLKDYPVRVIHNGIDLNVFKPTDSDWAKRFSANGKKIVLGVAFGWENRKGLDVFIELSEKLTEDYQIVLVGTNDTIDRHLPKNIMSIHKTQDQQELAALYTVADVLVNPTREDNYPTVNMEALACGTPVITFLTGGCGEMIDSTCGSVVEADNFDALIKEIVRVCCDKPYSKAACLKKAADFDMNSRFLEYIDLYKELYDGTTKN